MDDKWRHQPMHEGMRHYPRPRTGRPPVVDDDEFVLTLLREPEATYQELADRWGISRQAVSHRARSDRIKALVRQHQWDEVDRAKALLQKSVPKALETLHAIMVNTDAKDRDRIAAAKEILNRVPELAESRTVTVQGEGMFTAAAAVQALSELDVERLRAMAEGAGLGPPDTGWRPDVIDAQEEE